MSRSSGRVRSAATLLGLVLAASSCGWSTLGHDAARTGGNIAEIAISPGNVATLSEAWTATLGTGPSDQSSAAWSPVVGSHVVVVGSKDGVLRAFDAAGVTNCSGVPRACQPMWQAAVPGEPLTPTVSDATVHVTAGNSLYAFDATGVTNCDGVPRVCQPLWQASPAVDSPVVTGGIVYVSAGTTIAAYDAAGTMGCGGTPRTCEPIWRSQPAACAGVATECRFSAPSIEGGRLYAAWAGNQGLGQADLQAFDAAGIEGCGGAPRRCAPLWDVPIKGNRPTPPPSIARGRVFVLANYVDTISGGSPGAWLEAHDVSTGGLLWDSQFFGHFAYPPVVTNDRLYVPAGHVRVFDPAGVQGCVPNGAARRCAGLFDLAVLSYAGTAAVANGVLYEGSAPFEIEGTTVPAAVRAFDIAALGSTCGQFGTCAPVWMSPDLGGATSAPVVTNGVVYVTAATGTLHVFRLP